MNNFLSSFLLLDKKVKIESNYNEEKIIITTSTLTTILIIIKEDMNHKP